MNVSSSRIAKLSSRKWSKFSLKHLLLSLCNLVITGLMFLTPAVCDKSVK